MRVPRVLIVDDDADIREFVSWGLSDRGYQVSEAADGMAALEHLRVSAPDVIILDMRMPVMNGWDFLRAYRETPGPHVPVIIMTAYLSPSQIAEEAGAQGYISKPFDLVALVDVIRQQVPDWPDKF